MYRQFESSSSHVVQRKNETRGTILKKLELKNPEYLYLYLYLSGWRYVQHIEGYERRLSFDHKECHPRR